MLFDTVLQDIILPNEGVEFNPDGTVKDSGYTIDTGGETRFGISKKAYPGLDIKNLTLLQASDIYHRDYWNACSCDKVAEKSQALAIMLFDAGVNQGIGTAIKIFQSSLFVSPDGVIGIATLGAIKPEKEYEYLSRFADERLRRYVHLALLYKPSMQYLPGWINRVLNTKNYCCKSLGKNLILS